MNKSTKNIEIHKQTIYAYTKDLEKNGVAFVVVDLDEENVYGLRMMIGNPVRTSLPKITFENLLAYGLLERIEFIPKKEFKEFKKIYNECSVVK